MVSRIPFLLLLCSSFAGLAFAQNPLAPTPERGFEGQIDYEIRNDGVVWQYKLWMMGDRWRSELSQDGTLYELRIGDRSEGTVYLVNDAGKTYRPLGHGRPDGARPPEGGSKKLKGEPTSIDLDRIVDRKNKTRTILDHEARLDVMKGAGRKLDVWTTPDLGRYAGAAIPRFKVTEGRAREFVAYFDEYPGVPLAIEEHGRSGDKAFSCRAIAIEPTTFQDDALFTIPDDYKPEMGFSGGMRPPGGGERHRGHPFGGPPPNGDRRGAGR